MTMNYVFHKEYKFISTGLCYKISLMVDMTMIFWDHQPEYIELGIENCITSSSSSHQ